MTTKLPDDLVLRDGHVVNTAPGRERFFRTLLGLRRQVPKWRRVEELSHTVGEIVVLERERARIVQELDGEVPAGLSKPLPHQVTVIRIATVHANGVAECC